MSGVPCFPLRVWRTGERLPVGPSGGKALAAWLLSPTDYTLRYEPVLKACFLDQVDPELRRARARQDLAFLQGQVLLMNQRLKERPSGSPDRREDARAMAAAMYKALAGWAKAISEEDKD